MLALMQLAKQRKVGHLYIHGFLDGRDTAPESALPSLQKIVKCGEEQQLGHLVSICGRYYAMDRNQNWDRIKLAYDLIVDARRRI